MATGTVKFYNSDRGFGFITPDDGGKDLFVHAKHVASGIDVLREKQRVEFEIGTDRRCGKPQAEHVRVI